MCGDGLRAQDAKFVQSFHHAQVVPAQAQFLVGHALRRTWMWKPLRKALAGSAAGGQRLVRECQRA